MADVASAAMPVLPLIWNGTTYTATLPTTSPIQVYASTTLFARPLSQAGVGNWIGGGAPVNESNVAQPRFQLTDSIITDSWTIVQDNNGAPDPTKVIYSGSSPIPVPAFDTGFFYISRSIVGDPTLQYNISPNNNTPGSKIGWVTALTITITPPVTTSAISTATASAAQSRCVAQDNASSLQLEWLRKNRTQDNMDIQDLGLKVAVSSIRLGLSAQAMMLKRLQHHIVAGNDSTPAKTWEASYTLENFPDTDATGGSLYAVVDTAVVGTGRVAP